jgi:competence protein ComEC
VFSATHSNAVRRAGRSSHSDAVRCRVAQWRTATEFVQRCCALPCGAMAHGHRVRTAQLCVAVETRRYVVDMFYMRYKKSQIVFAVCACFIVGVAAGSLIKANLWWLWLILLSISLLISIINKKHFLLFCLLLACFLGFLRIHASEPKLTESRIAFYNEKKATFTAIVVEVDERLDQIKLTVDARSLNSKKVNGLVLIKTPLFPKYEYGDEVDVTCKLKTPQPIEDFRYDNYLARYNIYSVCYNAGIFVKNKNQGNWLKARLLNLKNILVSSINQTLPEPHAAFLAGILIGERKGLPPALVADFQTTGVSHIVAISGYNISVMAAMIMNLCLSFKINRKRAFFVIVIGLIFFVILTGASAAVIRAAVMGIIVLIAKQVGRQSQVRNVLALTALIMLIINPKILLYDAGFQLSFLATLGLIYFVPVIEKYFQWLPEKLAIRENLTTTMSAIIFTTPLILFQFGRLSIVAPLVNVLILSCIPLSMTIGFIQVLIGIFFAPAGRFVGYLTWLILTYIIKVVSFFGDWKYAAVEINFGLFFTIFCYIMLSVIILVKNKDKHEKSVDNTAVRDTGAKSG